MFKKKYRFFIESDTETWGQANEDTILNDLRKNRYCIDITPESKHISEVKKARFLYFDGRLLADINVGGCSCDNGIEYQREISLKIIPPSPEIPKELSDLLASRGFEYKLT